MGVRRQTRIVGFAIALFLVVAVYIRLWSVDSMDDSFTSDDREILRRQFEHANMEAMDESASWRMRYDGELERTTQYQQEILKVKGALEAANMRLAPLRRENDDLLKQVESLTQNVETMQQHCNCSRTGSQHQP